MTRHFYDWIRLVPVRFEVRSEDGLPVHPGLWWTSEKIEKNQNFIVLWNIGIVRNGRLKFYCSNLVLEFKNFWILPNGGDHPSWVLARSWQRSRTPRHGWTCTDQSPSGWPQPRDRGQTWNIAMKDLLENMRVNSCIFSITSLVKFTLSSSFRVC